MANEEPPPVFIKLKIIISCFPYRSRSLLLILTSKSPSCSKSYLLFVGVSCCSELAFPTSICSATLDAFTVVISRRSAVLDGDGMADANVEDIKIDSFSFSFRGKELLKNASVKVSTKYTSPYHLDQ